MKYAYGLALAAALVFGCSSSKENTRTSSNDTGTTQPGSVSGTGSTAGTQANTQGTSTATTGSTSTNQTGTDTNTQGSMSNQPSSSSATADNQGSSSSSGMSPGTAAGAAGAGAAGATAGQSGTTSGTSDQSSASNTAPSSADTTSQSGSTRSDTYGSTDTANSGQSGNTGSSTAGAAGPGSSATAMGPSSGDQGNLRTVTGSVSKVDQNSITLDQGGQDRGDVHQEEQEEQEQHHGLRLFQRLHGIGLRQHGIDRQPGRPDEPGLEVEHRYQRPEPQIGCGAQPALRGRAAIVGAPGPPRGDPALSLRAGSTPDPVFAVEIRHGRQGIPGP